MRDQPTSSEKEIANALILAFQKEGHSAQLPKRDIYDKPDILIDVNGILIACECIQIPPSYIYQFRHKKYKDSDYNGKSILSNIWPNEPHQWLVDAIKSKSPKIQEYLNRTKSKESWLVVHSPNESNQFLLQDSKTWVIDSLKHACKSIEHDFQQIYLWTPKRGIVSLFARQNNLPRTVLQIDFKNGYPTLCTNTFSYHFRTTKNLNDIPNKYKYGFDTRESKIITPLNSEYVYINQQ